MQLQTIFHWQSAPLEPICQQHEIHLWKIDLDINESQQRIAFSLLNETEQQRALRFYFPKHQRRFTAARIGLRKVLAQYLGIPGENIQFEYGSHGKPFITPLQNPSNINFNLSHSGELALCAITLEQPVGVDIEQTSQRDYLALAKRFFSAKEYQALLKLPAQQHEAIFFHIWTQKEAFIKAIGDGLSYPLETFNVSALPPAQLLHIDNDDAHRWFSHSFAINPNYYAAVTSSQKINQIEYFMEPLASFTL